MTTWTKGHQQLWYVRRLGTCATCAHKSEEFPPEKKTKKLPVVIEDHLLAVWYFHLHTGKARHGNAWHIVNTRSARGYIKKYSLGSMSLVHMSVELTTKWETNEIKPHDMNTVPATGE